VYWLAIATLGFSGVLFVFFRGAPDLPSVGIMPFVNMTGDSSNNYLSEGLTEELIAALVQMGGVRVPPRTSSFVVAAKKLAVPEIAKELTCPRLREATARELLRITAQLVAVTTVMSGRRL
jgi:TolB-like protein